MTPGRGRIQSAKGEVPPRRERSQVSLFSRHPSWASDTGAILLARNTPGERLERRLGRRPVFVNAKAPNGAGSGRVAGRVAGQVGAARRRTRPRRGLKDRGGRPEASPSYPFRQPRSEAVGRGDLREQRRVVVLRRRGRRDVGRRVVEEVLRQGRVELQRPQLHARAGEELERRPALLLLVRGLSIGSVSSYFTSRTRPCGHRSAAKATIDVGLERGEQRRHDALGVLHLVGLVVPDVRGERHARHEQVVLVQRPVARDTDLPARTSCLVSGAKSCRPAWTSWTGRTSRGARPAPPARSAATATSCGPSQVRAAAIALELAVAVCSSHLVRTCGSGTGSPARPGGSG